MAMNSSEEQERYCLSCRHSLRGLASRECPECGRAFDPGDKRTFAETNRRDPRWLRWIVVAISLYPLLALALLYGTWLAAAVSLGHWPRPSRDDPKYINGFVSTLHTMTWIAIMFASPAFAANAIALVADGVSRWWYNRRFPAKTIALAGIAACLWITVIALVKIDPGRVLYWFMD
jgi:hypothetical protein